MVKSMEKIIAFAIFYILAAVVTGQTSTHERLGVERKDLVGITIGGSVGIVSFTNSGLQGLQLDPTATLDSSFSGPFHSR